VSQWFERMREYEVKPNSSTYSIILNSYMKKGLTDKADELFDSMISEVSPTLIVYNTMISGYAKLVQEDKVFEYYNLLQKDNLEADAYTCIQNEQIYRVDNGLDTGLLLLYFRKGDLEKMEHFLQEGLSKGLVFDADAYSWFGILNTVLFVCLHP
jgi:pentatricopeptide repeat protein